VATALVLLFTANQGPDWQLHEPVPEGSLIVDGSPIPLDRIDEVNDHLQPGARLALTDSVDVTLVSNHHLLIQLAPGTEVTLPERPKRWSGRDLHTEITRGRIRITTRSRFEGAVFNVRTPEATVMISGTTLAVILESYGTCVCVYEGSVQVTGSGDSHEEVPEGTRMDFYNDGRPPALAEIRPKEFQILRMLESL
jgi:hypothetical protein